MLSEYRSESKKGADHSRFGTKALWLSVAGAILMLGACAPDREGGTTRYPDRWEYRQSPSDNYGKIYRY